MIDPDMRNAIFQLHQEGMSMREISRRLHVSRSAVRSIVRQQGKITRKERKPMCCGSRYDANEKVW